LVPDSTMEQLDLVYHHRRGRNLVFHRFSTSFRYSVDLTNTNMPHRRITGSRSKKWWRILRPEPRDARFNCQHAALSTESWTASGLKFRWSKHLTETETDDERGYFCSSSVESSAANCSDLRRLHDVAVITRLIGWINAEVTGGEERWNEFGDLTRGVVHSSLNECRFNEYHQHCT